MHFAGPKVKKIQIGGEGADEVKRILSETKEDR